MGKKIDDFVLDIDKTIEKAITDGTDKQRIYKETRAEAIKIETPKIGSWPYVKIDSTIISDSKVKTIGDLFAYVFPNPDGDEFREPNDPYDDIRGFKDDLPFNEDKSIVEKYNTLKKTYRKTNKKYSAIKNIGGGQYLFDFIMYNIQVLLKTGNPWEKWIDGKHEYEKSKLVEGEKITFDYPFLRKNVSSGTSGSSETSEKKFVRINKISDLETLGNFESLFHRIFYELKRLKKEGENFISEKPRIIDLNKSLEDICKTSVLEISDEEERFNLLYLAVLEAGDGYTGKYTGEIDKLYKDENYYFITHLKYEPDPPPVPDPPVISPPPAQTPPAPDEARGPKKVDSDFTFNVEKEGVFLCLDDSIGELTIVKSEKTTYETIDPTNTPTKEETLDPEYTEDEYDIEEEKETIFVDIQSKALSDPNPTAESTARVEETNIDYNSTSYVGSAWKSFGIEEVVSKINTTKHKCASKFIDSLKKVLFYIKNDVSMDDIRKAAYLLGTAYAESGYSLQRWEADYACGPIGVKYGPGGPCQAALNYYKSTKGKKNYYTLGTDSNGMPYFGRGLIQLTGKDNYAKYGKRIGQDLLNNGDMAMEPQNSYKIAVEFMKGGTFKHVLKGDLTTARKSVNGGNKGIEEVNGAYNDWLKIFSQYNIVA